MKPMIEMSQAPETPVILQKSRLIIAVAMALLLSFTFLGCEKRSREVDADFMKSFFTAYYQNQIDYGSKLMDVIAAEMGAKNASGSQLTDTAASGGDWQSADGFLWLKDYVTGDCTEKLLLNRYYPSQAVIAKGFDQFELKDFTTKQQSYDGYDQWTISFTVAFSQKGTEAVHQKVTAVMDTDDTKTRINTITLVQKKEE